MKIAYSSGDSGHPCATPRCTAKAGDRAAPTRTLLDADEYSATKTANTGLDVPQRSLLITCMRTMMYPECTVCLVMYIKCLHGYIIRYIIVAIRGTGSLKCGTPESYSECHWRHIKCGVLMFVELLSLCRKGLQSRF